MSEAPYKNISSTEASKLPPCTGSDLKVLRITIAMENSSYIYHRLCGGNVVPEFDLNLQMDFLQCKGACGQIWSYDMPFTASEEYIGKEFGIIGRELEEIWEIYFDQELGCSMSRKKNGQEIKS